MSITEIVLLILGIGIFAAGFIIPEKRASLSEKEKSFGEEQIKELLDQQMQDVRAKVSGVVDETVTYAVEKTERSMERITNEKIMAVNEYSDTVLEEIHKNHEEVVFLYDMLNDKQQTLKDTAIEVEKKAKEARKSAEAALTAAGQQSTGNGTGSAAGQQGAGNGAGIAGQQSAGNADGIAAQQGDGNGAGTAGQRNVGNAAGNAAWQSLGQVIESAGQSMEKPEAAAALSATEEKQPEKRTRTKKAVEAKSEEVKSGKEKSETAGAGTTKAGAAKAARAKQQTLSPEEGSRGALPAVSLSFADAGENGKNNNEKILALHKEGKSNMAIARELGLGIGEVKLVIDLFKGA